MTTIDRRKDNDMLAKAALVATVAGGVISVLCFAGVLSSFVSEMKAKDILAPTQEQVSRNTTDIANAKKKDSMDDARAIRMEDKLDDIKDLIISLKNK